jgi:protein TonB
VDDVSQVLASRTRDLTGIEMMSVWAVLAHGGLLLAIAVMPSGWLGARIAEDPAVVMTIGLAAPPGERTGGMTAISSRPVQEIRPVEAPKAIEPVRPPAARAPEMVEPVKAAPPKRPDPPTKVNTPDPNTRSQTPTKGEEIRQGTAIAETGARGQGFGLTSGGGGTGATVDSLNFCCPEYIATMVELVNRNWSSKVQSNAVAVIKVTVQRDGTLTNIELEKSTGMPPLDLMAQRALVLTKQLPPLPRAFTESSLTVHLTFEYTR